MSSTVQASDELLPGYVLEERIGSGGYAEVWRARAPGGIDKAVKIVFGYFDEELAIQEMKSLERIKDVRHPFLLSLERFEVVDGRLAIITELADMSLEQRAQQCRAEGLPGIPREELLRYMADAAEALDYLATRHGLQHLDVKPANLLISGDHLKVADFGLVKELTSHTQNSLVAGMTPSYSAPEMFDDSPSPHSDQYSLAIVYQEMLVGSLPFPGRTAAQLAKQHTLAQPQLTALPSFDREIIARALAKAPHDRFASCRDFAKSLREASDDFGTGKPPSTQSKQWNERETDHKNAEETKKTASGETCRSRRDRSPISPSHTLTRTAISGAERKPPSSAAVDFRTAPIVDVESPELTTLEVPHQPTLIVAIGGVGIRILSRVREYIAERIVDDQPLLPLEYLAVDTDRRELQESTSRKLPSPLDADDTLHLPLRLPQDYLEQSQGSLEWLSRRWLYNIPRSLETRGYRPLGRLALVDQMRRATGPIDKKLANLQRLQSSSKLDEESALPIRVVILAGMGGGTGAGMAIDFANAIRSRAHAQSIRIELQAVLVCTCPGGINATPLAVANTFSLLTELNHATQFGNRGQYPNSEDDSSLESNAAPFDSVYCVPASSRKEGSNVCDGLRSIAKYIALDLGGTTDALLRAWRTHPTPQEAVSEGQLRMRSFGWASLAAIQQQRINQVAASLQASVRGYWLEEIDDEEWMSLDHVLTMEVDEPHKRRAEYEAEPSMDGQAVSESFAKLALQDLRAPFGAYRTSRFALQFLSQLVRILKGTDKVDLGSFSQRRLASLIQMGSLAASTIAQPGDATQFESKDSSCIADTTFEITVSATCAQLICRMISDLDALRGDTSSINDLVARLLTDECRAQVDALVTNSAGTPGSFQLSREDCSSALEQASPGLLQCSGDRRTAFLQSEDESDSEVISTLRTLRPTGVDIQVNVKETMVLCETSGIAPLSMAHCMQHVYPDIADAARRLYSRTDIEWQEFF